MSYWRRRRSFFSIFEDMLQEMEEFFYDIECEIERMLRGGREIRGPYVYGVRIVIGPDGQPIIEEFGNIRRRGRRAEIREEMEPLVDVIEEKDKVIVIAEIPGVEKDKIDVRVKDKTLVISASDKDRKYYKEVELPAEVKPETAKAKYKNGVLEVVLEKKKPSIEEEGVRVRVE